MEELYSSDTRCFRRPYKSYWKNSGKSDYKETSKFVGKFCFVENC